jgi:CBS domain-containing protein
MKATIEHFEKDVVTIGSAVPVRDAADAMRNAGVGSLVVTDAEGHPIGIVTDRDLLERVIAESRDVGTTSVGDVMTRPLHSAAPSDPLDRVVEVMSAHGVRRVPIVRDGALTGMVSLDDVLVSVSEELYELTAGRKRALSATERAARARELARDIGQRARDVAEQLDDLGTEIKGTLARELESLQDKFRSRRGSA